MKFLNEKAINRVTEKSRWNHGKFYSIGRGTFERDKEDRKLRQNSVIRPRKEGRNLKESAEGNGKCCRNIKNRN